MFVWFLRDPDAVAPRTPGVLRHPQPGLTPRPAYGAMPATASASRSPRPARAYPTTRRWPSPGLGPGHAPEGRPVYTATTPNSTATLTFEGDILDLVFAPGATRRPCRWNWTARRPRLAVDSTGRALTAIPAAGTTANRVTPDPAWPAPPGLSAVRLQVAGDLKDTRHTVTIRPANVDAPVALLGFVVGRESPQAGLFAAGYLLLTGLALWLGVRSTFAIVALPRLVRQAVALPGLTGDGARAGVVVAAMTAALAAYYLLPSPRWALRAAGRLVPAGRLAARYGCGDDRRRHPVRLRPACPA